MVKQSELEWFHRLLILVSLTAAESIQHLVFLWIQRCSWQGKCAEMHALLCLQSTVLASQADNNIVRELLLVDLFLRRHQ